LASLETESDSKSRDNLEGLNDSMWVKTSPPYIYEGAQLIEGYPIIKNIKALLFLSPNPNSSFPNPNFLSSFIPAVFGSRSSWPLDTRSTQSASSLMGSLPRGSSLVQATEVVLTDLTGLDYRSD
jgi:hypothetical protein